MKGNQLLEDAFPCPTAAMGGQIMDRHEIEQDDDKDIDAESMNTDSDSDDLEN